MARKIDSLLNKKGWTGVEVGKALVASIIHDIRHQSEPDYKPLFSQSDFDKMESSLNTERDYLAYGVYRDLYSGLIDAYNRGQGQHQQFYNGYYRYAMHLKDCTVAEQTLQTAELTPYVMTQEQYNKLKEQRETTLRGFTESFSGLLFTLLSHIMDSPEDAPEAIRTAIEATKKEAVTNERILSSYCEVYGMGYYQLPDGTRSDSFEGEGWQEKLKEEYLKTHKLRINGKPASFEDTVLHYNTERRLKGYELYFNGIDAVKKLYEEHTGKELQPEDEVGIMKALESLLNLRDDENPVEKKTVPLHPAVLQIKVGELLPDRSRAVGGRLPRGQRRLEAHVRGDSRGLLVPRGDLQLEYLYLGCRPSRLSLQQGGSAHRPHHAGRGRSASGLGRPDRGEVPRGGRGRPRGAETHRGAHPLSVRERMEPRQAHRLG